MTATIDGTPFDAALVNVGVGAPSTLNFVGTSDLASSPRSHATGTSQFIAEPDAGTVATGQVSVASGTFDITF